MKVLFGLIIALVVTALLRKAIKKVPLVFYMLALLLSALFIVRSSLPLPSWFHAYVLFLLQSCTLAMGFFTIVMFTGVLDERSALRKALVPIRGELSIIASLLCVGHIVSYGQSYIDQLLRAGGYVPEFRVAATMVAFVMVVLLIPLTLTSFRHIRAKMKLKHWKDLQRFAYVFYGLVFIHLLFYLLQPALAGGGLAALSVAIYLILGILYATLRIRLALRSR